ncbi:MAG: SMC-Scp complex subunit ScpB [Chitinivibrionales bacterium]|nr:SMC-Scp complex subunit ScpB [Chitinivibrionales bacterium]
MPESNGAQQRTHKKPMSESLQVLESLLFASEEILPPARLRDIMPDRPDAHAIRKMVESINQRLQQERHPFEIVEVAGGYQFRTVPYFSPWVRQLFKERNLKKLSIQALECLAIIAYKQPITKAEIEAIRGVVSDGAMKTLLERRLVTITGRSEKAGRPLLYATTREFLEYFGLKKISDLPRLEEFEAMAREKMDEIEDAVGRPSGSPESSEQDAAASADEAGTTGSLSGEQTDAQPQSGLKVAGADSREEKPDPDHTN